MAVVLEATVARRSRPYLAALLGLLALTAVVLVSAALRLRLYQDAYGWTELRLYVLTTIVAARGGARAHDRASRSPAGCAGWGTDWRSSGSWRWSALNLVAPAAFVAARNVERVIDPTLVAAGRPRRPRRRLSRRPARRRRADPGRGAPAHSRRANDRPVLAILQERKAELATDPAFASPAAWNLGRERARAALATLP